MRCRNWRHSRFMCDVPAQCLLRREDPWIRRGDDGGMLAGAFTESTVIGTAGDAINRLSISAQEKNILINNIRWPMR